VSYYIFIITTMLVLPLVAGSVEMRIRRGNIFSVFGRYFVLFAIGLRLLVTGSMQLFNPGYTLEMLGAPHSAALPVMELGAANLVFAFLALLYFRRNSFAGFAGGYYMGATGILHLLRAGSLASFREALALVSDLWILAIVCILTIHGLRASGKCGNKGDTDGNGKKGNGTVKG